MMTLYLWLNVLNFIYVARNHNSKTKLQTENRTCSFFVEDDALF